MEARLRSFLLSSLVGGFYLFATSSHAAEPSDTDKADAELKPVIQPEIKRQEFDEARIDTEDFEVGVFLGIYSTEDFGTNPVYGARLAYHITDRLFVEGAIGQTTTERTSWENLLNPGGAGILSDDGRTLTYYSANIGFNLLPGEAFMTQDVTYNTALYVVAGVGSTNFDDSDRFTLNFGVGYSFLATDYMAVHIDFRDYIFNMELPEDKTTNNLEFTASLSFFF
jgi:outer membrane beta-barrel protein